MNQILKQCDGKINQFGWCDKCYQPAHTTSNQCNRYLPLEQLQQPVVMQVPQFEELLQVRLAELPYTKHLDDGQYNDGQAYGFECGARWAYEKLSSGTAVGKAGEDASVSDGK
jgi:hypothetical protein